MKLIIKKLSELQVDAYIKGISFDTDVIVGEKDSVIDVKMTFVTNGTIDRRYMFETTFTSDMNGEETETRLNSIQHFISTVTE